jgi:fermentation-respiration switch protein FrsA (DUF1100 family)
MASIVLIPILVYIGLLIFAYFFADRMIFQPQSSFYKDDPDILKLTTPNGEKISAKYYPNPDSDFTILFSHGNAEDIGTADPFIKELQSNGFAALSYDYRGYGTSGGKATETEAYEDIDSAYRYLTQKLNIPAKNIIVHGRSLGAAVALDLASREQIGGLIVESAFTSAFRVITKIRIAPFDKFDNTKKIEKVGCPVLFIHGRMDRLIPFWHGEQLFSLAHEPKFSLWIDNAGHNNLFDSDRKEYLRAIKEFSYKLAK